METKATPHRQGLRLSKSDLCQALSNRLKPEAFGKHSTTPHRQGPRRGFTESTSVRLSDGPKPEAFLKI
ncbi:hypothetical protein BGZ81_002954 [Podila clonocystis]|nr:hypothetical protein BGZ81_002954 [Podila clonocystis]